MINKYEAVGIFASIGLMVFALFLLRVETTSEVAVLADGASQAASISIVDETNANQSEALYGAVVDSVDESGAVNKLIIDDVVIGTGAVAEVGDTVTLHYIGTLQTGEQFDNSNTRGAPFTFTLGQNRVIQGWEEGILGMQVGGERILVIPPTLGYGEQNVGPIPANSTLIFAVELLSIN